MIRQHFSPSALHRYEGLSSLIGAEVYVKHENHNPTGTFKIRGGLNLLHHLAEYGVPGVITFSTGNHGTSIAASAKTYGLQAVVVVPENTNPAKTRAIREAGAELIESGESFDAAAYVVEQLQKERGLYYAHPADEPELINGVGICFLEMLAQLPDLDVVIIPLGAGSEVASAIKVFEALKPDVDVIAVQAKEAPAAYLSWRDKGIRQADNRTFAGGLATGRGYQTTFDLYRDKLCDFVLLSEEELIEAVSLALHYTHNLAEAAGAASIIAACKLRKRLKDKKVVLQMSGSKASPRELSSAVQHPRFLSG